MVTISRARAVRYAWLGSKWVLEDTPTCLLDTGPAWTQPFSYLFKSHGCYAPIKSVGNGHAPSHSHTSMQYGIPL